MGRSVARAILEGIRKKQEELEKPKGSKLQEDSGLQMYATEPPGAMSEKDWITVEQMEEICSECAGNMRERNMTRIAMKEALECGLVEYVDEANVDEQGDTIGAVGKTIGKIASIPVRGVGAVTRAAGRGVSATGKELGEKKDDGWPKKLKKGRFSEYCRREGFSGPGIECARKAMDSEDASVRGMASFYMNTVQPKGKTATAVAGEKECGPTPDDEG